MYTCDKCNRTFKNNGAKHIHQKNCNGIGTKSNIKENGLNYICSKCGYRIKTSVQKHFNSCNGFGPRRKQPIKEKIPWNKGLTKDIDIRLKNFGDKLSHKYKKGELIGFWLGKKIPIEIVEKMKKRKVGGIVKRSKNEIYFAELCKKHFNNVLENECIFNGWDADVIIEDIKTAVLWNGKWHYEKIKKEHSVEQVQNRDKIKLYEIQKNGYKPYVIKDMGKCNNDFVEIQFDIFLKWTNGIITKNVNDNCIINKKIDIENCIIKCKKCKSEIKYGQKCKICEENSVKKSKNKIKKRSIKENDNLCKCGNKKLSKSKLCDRCNRILVKKSERPPYEQLLLEISELGYVSTGKKYGVSDNTIRKWKKNYEKNVPIV